MEHSAIMGGSTAARRINCPGSYNLEGQVPKPPDSEFAKQGTVYHAVMELMLVADPNGDLETKNHMNVLVGQDMGFGPDWKITEEQVNTKIMPAWGAWMEAKEKYGIDDWFIEQRVSLEKVIPGAYGTVDILGIGKDKWLNVVDWKFGDGVVVPAEANTQLGFYAACALYDEDDEIKEFCADVQGVRLIIIQPRVGSDHVLDVWETDEEWIEKLVDLAATAADAAVKPNATIKAGDHCRWCRAKVICPAYKELGTTALGKEPKSMSAVELATALDSAKLLKGWIADVYALAQLELESGANVPGWKLVEKRPRRMWADIDEVIKLLKRRKVKVSESYKRVLMSPAQMEKSIPTMYSKVLDKLVELKSSGLTLVEDSDKRAAVQDQFALLAAAQVKATGKGNGK